jgi:periplasmic divalent cation tolerance protein
MKMRRKGTRGTPAKQKIDIAEDAGASQRSRGRHGQLGLEIPNLGRKGMMRNRGPYRIVLVTCASMAEARKIARLVIGKRLAACANILPNVESIYRWKGKIERSREVLMILKTSAARLRELEREVEQQHSYDVPEFIVLPILVGSKQYLEWIGESTQP